MIQLIIYRLISSYKSMTIWLKKNKIIEVIPRYIQVDKWWLPIMPYSCINLGVLLVIGCGKVF